MRNVEFTAVPLSYLEAESTAPVRCCLSVLDHIKFGRGQAFYIGVTNAIRRSLRELLATLERRYSIQMKSQQPRWRVSDDKPLVAEGRSTFALL